MSLFVLDTDTLTLFQRRHPPAVSEFQKHAPSEVATTVISLEEQLSGWYALLRRAKTREQIAEAYNRLASLVKALAPLQLLPFDLTSIATFELLVGLRLNVGRNDLRIAAIVLNTEDAMLVTRNTRDFSRIPGLKLVNWADPIA